VHGEPSLPGVEGPSCQVEEPLGEKDGMALSELHGSASNFGAGAAPKEQGVNVRAFDAPEASPGAVVGSEARGHEVGVRRALTKSKLGAKRQRGVPVRLHHDRHGLG